MIKITCSIHVSDMLITFGTCMSDGGFFLFDLINAKLFENIMESDM